MEKQHRYEVPLKWIGNKGTGTSSYVAYDRNFEIECEGKSPIPGSSDPSFRGDKTRYNAEELLVASLSSCHMLWYLHLCAQNGIVVVDYQDNASGTMIESADGSGFFKEVTLYPQATLTDEAMIEVAKSLHHQANQMCFIAKSCNFPVYHRPEFKIKTD